MNWYKKSQGYIAHNISPYSLLEIIKMQQNGLPLNTMSKDELNVAKELEQIGQIKKVVKRDEKGNYSAYIINKDFNEEQFAKDTIQKSVNSRTAQAQKVMYLCRGISGSGKSTLAKQFSRDGIILSTDDFFTMDGQYQYDPTLIADAHLWNQARTKDAMQKQITPIVIDNTNIRAWEMKPYVQLAQIYGYKVEIKEANTPWRFDAEELAKRNKHDVPKDVIEKMISNYDKNVTIEDILKSEKPKS